MADDFRKQDGQQTGGVEQFEAPPRAALRENAHQFVARPLGRNRADLLVQPLDGREGRRLDLEPEARGKADGAQHAQVVLAEPHLRVADGADHARPQVLAAADEIEHLVRIGIEQQAVDGEVAPEDVLPRVGLELNRGSGRRPSR